MRERGILVVGAVLLGLALLGVFLYSAHSQLPSEHTNLLFNGDFEVGFVPDPTCGLVGQGWRCFKGDGATTFVAQPETWEPAVRSGRYAQLLGVVTQVPGAPPNRVFGLYQRVRVVPGATYTLLLWGLIRADDTDPDPWRYRVEWGIDPQGGTDWRRVTEWHEVPWNRYDPKLAPGPYQEYRVSLTPSGPRLTLFVRLRVKWGTWPREVILNLDDLALVGPRPSRARVQAPATPAPPAPAASPPRPTPLVAAAGSAACTGPNALRNGDFEEGFAPAGVALGWYAFQTGGPASFGFWDAGPLTGRPEDAHGQTVAINTMGLPQSETTLTAGITQTVRGLAPGRTYALCVRGLLSGTAPVTDTTQAPVAEWGVVAQADASWETVTNWNALPWQAMAEGAVMTYTATFTPGAPAVTLAFRLRAARSATVVP